MSIMGWVTLHASCGGVPDELVHLDLHSDIEAVFEDPGGKLEGGDLSEDGGEEDGVAADEAAVDDLFAGPLVVGAVGEDDLDFVVGLQEGEVLPAVALHLAGAGRLEVVDFADGGGDRGDVEAAGGLEEDFEASVEAGLHEGVDAGLQEGFTTGDFDEIAGREGGELGEDFVEGHPAATCEGVDGVAPGAAEVAAGESNEVAASAGVGGLALNAVEDFGDAESLRLGLFGGYHVAVGGPCGRWSRALCHGWQCSLVQEHGVAPKMRREDGWR